jgi:hypothetical protein
MALRELPHLLLRYEDMASDPAMRQRVADFVGFERLSERRENLEAGGMMRQWELAKHGEGLSTRSVGRYREEPRGPVKALAERVWRLLPEYSEAFGYETPPPESWIRGHDFSSRGAGAPNPIVYRTAERPDWKGPAQFEPSFALRAARRFIAPRLPKGAVVAELGCGTPALMTLLSKGVTFIPADVAQRADNYRVARLDELRFPALPKATHLVILGWLELLTPDLAKLLRVLRRYDRPIIASYVATDDSAGIDRASHGWLNHLDRKGLASACRAAGFRLTASWARLGPQSLLHLRPLPARGAKVRRPEAALRSAAGARSTPIDSRAGRPK